MLLPIRTPRQSEPKSIAEFLRAGHPWMALAIALSWLWRSAVIVIVLLTIRVFSAPDDRRSLSVSSQPTAFADAQIAAHRIK